MDLAYITLLNPIEEGMSFSSSLLHRHYFHRHYFIVTISSSINMNSYFSATLPLWGAIAPLVITLATPDPAIARTAAELEQMAADMTVLIDGINPGSGVIVGRQGDRYWVLTAGHVVATEDEYWLVAPDGQDYPIDYRTVRRLAGIDLAVLEFRSDRTYRVATLATYPPDQQFPYVFVSGRLGSYLQQQPMEHQFVAGLLLRQTYALLQSQDPLAGGYDLFYTNITRRGMSGGPILDTDGRVVGIHGRSEGEEIADARGNYQRLFLGFSGGISSQTFVQRVGGLEVAAQLRVTGDRPTPLTPTAQRSIAAILEPSPVADVTDPIAWTNRGNQLYRLERFSESLAAFERALQLQPDFHQAWYGQGQVLTTQGRYDDALQAFERALAIAPNFHLALRDRALVYALQESYEAAIADLDRVVQLAPDDYIAWYLRGNLFSRRMGWHDAALGAYDRALSLAPNFALVWVERGRTLHEMGDSQEALSSLRQATVLEPDLDVAWYWQGQVLLATGEAELGLTAADRAIALTPDNPDYWLLRARSLLALGRTNEAQTDIQRVLDRRPGDQEAQAVLRQLSAAP